LAPVEYQPGDPSPPSGRMVLTKGEPATFRDWTLVFTGFDMAGQHAMGESMNIGITVTIERPGEEPVTVTPRLIASGEGLRPVPVEIPGTNGTIEATAMAVDAGQVQVELRGLGGGIGFERRLGIGEETDYRDLHIRFDGFDLSEFDSDAGKMDFGAVFSVRRNGEEFTVVPWYRVLDTGPTADPAAVPGTGGITLMMGRVSAEDGSVELKIFDPSMPGIPAEPASLVLDVSVKPLVSLVWIGTLLMILGTTLALFVRRRGFAAIEEG